MMTIARSKQVDTSITRWYHCISRCVRRAKLLCEPDAEQQGWRKRWIERRLRKLADVFAVSVAGFSLMDNHFHVLLRLDPDVAKTWLDRDVVRRWFELYPPRGADRKPLSPEQLELLFEEKLKDQGWLTTTRDRLTSLSWFMKCLKEPLSRMINEAEECTGAFFEGRFKSIAILDEEALMAVCAYIDLNPVSAGVAETPEDSEYTSVNARVVHAARQGRVGDLRAAKSGSVAASNAASKLEDALWLVPVEDRRKIDSIREGMFVGFTLGNYLMLLEYTGRMFRNGKAAITSEVSDIFVRLGSTAEQWRTSIRTLQGTRLIGRVIASSKDKLRAAAKKFGVANLRNLHAR